VFLEAQLDAVLSDIGADAAKTGMLHSAEVIETVAWYLRHHKVAKLVVDPVMVSTSGSRLLEESAVEALLTELIPLAMVVTPNLAEAEILSGLEYIRTQDQMLEAGRIILRRTHCQAVLVKGGHLEGHENFDLLVEDSEATVLPGRYIDTPNTHGTGCTLSAAIATYSGFGDTLPEACRKAKAYLQAALEAGKDFRFGKGNGPVWHSLQMNK
jgi:hydroxymethylpyrimidine/phosphomethylpyrimidine kinase